MKLMTALRDYFQGHTVNYLQGTRGKSGQAGEMKQPSLTDMMSTSATGWAAVINGVLDARTVSDSKNMSALYALRCSGHNLMNPCGDTDCDCNVKVLAGMAPRIKLVPIKIEVQSDA